MVDFYDCKDGIGLNMEIVEQTDDIFHDFDGETQTHQTSQTNYTQFETQSTTIEQLKGLHLDKKQMKQVLKKHNPKNDAI